MLCIEIYCNSQSFKRIKNQNVHSTFVNSYYLSSFSTGKLIDCLRGCMNNCQCGTVLFENKSCTLLNAVPLISQIISAPGINFYMSNF